MPDPSAAHQSTTPAALGFLPDTPDAPVAAQNSWRREIRGRRFRFARLLTLRELQPLETLQRDVMGMTDLDVVSGIGLLLVPETGGAILGVHAEDDPDTVVGVVIGWGGFPEGRPRLLSDFMGVVPAFRSAGLGAELKRLQAAIAHGQGFPEIAWTVDPLRAANARLNLERLGATSHHYEINRYGDDFGVGLYGGMPTDRLHLSLDLTSREVWDRLRGEIAPRTAATISDLLPFTPGMHGEAALVAIPHDIDELVATDLKTALSWRLRVREALTAAFAEGYEVGGFVSAEPGSDRAHLVLRRTAANELKDTHR